MTFTGHLWSLGRIIVESMTFTGHLWSLGRTVVDYLYSISYKILRLLRATAL